MKKILTFTFAILISYACSAKLQQGYYRISGNIAGADGSYAYLYHSGSADSVKIENGKFVFQNPLAYPDMFGMRVGKGEFKSFFLEAGEVAVSGTASSLSIQGDGVRGWDEYMTKLKYIYDGMGENARKSNQKSKSERTPEEEKALSSEFLQLQAEGQVLIREFILSHPSSALSPWLITNFFSTGDAAAEKPELYKKLDDAAKQSHYGVLIKKEMEAAATVAVGAKAPAFTLVDKDGKDVSLADYKGKYVILDFWGSWCAPCRKSHPHLVELYNRYKGENFDIVGLAGRDKQRDKWLKAIEEDGLVWRHANLEENKAKQDVGALYNIKGYPTKVLVGPDGTILAYTLGGSEAIDSKLKEVFGK